ncbi:MAG: hypothetical protein KJ804_17520 [Proteobacteria bacterium]|nr:hypothetical protein [Pseudomonadota bacterium]MBU1060107.1 hypothetical protein [Pseudomonadota bacterium]
MKPTITSCTRIIAFFAIGLFFSPWQAESWSSSSSWDNPPLSENSLSSGLEDYSVPHSPPPGWADSSLSEALCRSCHEDLDRFPGLQYSNPDKHHLLIGQEIPQPTIAPYQPSAYNYECLSCHLIEQTDAMNFEVSLTRDCLQCHPLETVSGSSRRGDNVHHEFPSYHCSNCHSWGR